MKIQIKKGLTFGKNDKLTHHVILLSLLGKTHAKYRNNYDI